MVNDKVENDKIYQGIIIVEGDILGGKHPFSIVYYTKVKGIYDSATESKESSGHKIVDHKYIWLDEPTDWESIKRIGRKMEAEYRSRK